MHDRQTRWISALALLAVLAQAASSMATPIHDLDVWFHLSGAREMHASGRVPFEDTYTWVSAGRPWLDLHWLFQLLIGAVQWAFGMAGLVVLKMVLGAALVLSTHGVLRGAAPRDATTANDANGFTLLACMPLVFALTLRPILRPELLTLLLFVWQMRAWVALRAGRRSAALWILLLQVGLVNVQGLFVLGFVLGGAFLVASLWQRRDVAWSSLTLVGLLVASLLNPYGWHAFELPLQLLRRIDGTESPFAAIAEFHGSFVRVDATAVLSGALVAITGMGWVWAVRTRRAVAWSLLSAAGCMLAFLARRNLTLQAIAVAPLFVQVLTALPFRRPAAVRVAVSSALMIAAAILTVDCWNGKKLQPLAAHRETRLGLDRTMLPERAFAYLRSRAFEGRHFVDLNLGGYDVFVHGRDHRCLTDARLEVLGEDGFARYLRMLGNPAFFDRTCDEFRLEAAVIDHRAAHQRIVLDHLFASSDWRVVYGDPAFFVFARFRGEHTRSLLERPDIAPDLLFSMPPVWSRHLRESMRGIARSDRSGP